MKTQLKLKQKRINNTKKEKKTFTYSFLIATLHWLFCIAFTDEQIENSLTKYFYIHFLLYIIIVDKKHLELKQKHIHVVS